MIVFNRLWETMENKGVSTYTLREKYGIDSKILRRLLANENIERKRRTSFVRFWTVRSKKLWNISEKGL